MMTVEEALEVVRLKDVIRAVLMIDEGRR